MLTLLWFWRCSCRRKEKETQFWGPWIKKIPLFPCMSLHRLLGKWTAFSKLKLGSPNHSSLAHRYVGCMSVLCDSHCVTANVFIFPHIETPWLSFYQIPLLIDGTWMHHILMTGLSLLPKGPAQSSCWHPPGRHCMEASSLCPQSLWLHGLAGQSHREVSFPLHLISLSHIGPVPGP